MQRVWSAGSRGAFLIVRQRASGARPHAGAAKEHVGGNPGSGSFPTFRTAEDWQQRVVDARSRSPLHKLNPVAVELIYNEQPLHRPHPAGDPLAIVNKLDNDDKHRLLQVPFVYPDHSQGTNVIDVLDRKRVYRVRIGGTRASRSSMGPS